jgi:hypothetical protein
VPIDDPPDAMSSSERTSEDTSATRRKRPRTREGRAPRAQPGERAVRSRVLL